MAYAALPFLVKAAPRLVWLQPNALTMRSTALYGYSDYERAVLILDWFLFLAMHCVTLYRLLYSQRCI